MVQSVEPICVGIKTGSQTESLRSRWPRNGGSLGQRTRERFLACLATELSENKHLQCSIDLLSYQDWVRNITPLPQTVTPFGFVLGKSTRPPTPRASRHGQRVVHPDHSFVAFISRKMKMGGCSYAIQPSEQTSHREPTSDSWPCGAALRNLNSVRVLHVKPS